MVLPLEAERKPFFSCSAERWGIWCAPLTRRQLAGLQFGRIRPGGGVCCRFRRQAREVAGVTKSRNPAPLEQGRKTTVLRHQSVHGLFRPGDPPSVQAERRTVQGFSATDVPFIQATFCNRLQFA